MKKAVTINNHFKQTGASLMEALAFIIISLLVVGGAVAMWSMTSNGGKENAAMNQIVSIQMSYRGAYSGQSTYGSGDITDTQKLPSDLKVSGTTVTNGWNGTVAVTGAGATFTITWGGVPNVSCPKIAISKSDWSAVSINGTSQTLPVSTAAATAACNAGTNTLVFTSN